MGERYIVFCWLIFFAFGFTHQLSPLVSCIRCVCLVDVTSALRLTSENTGKINCSTWYGYLSAIFVPIFFSFHSLSLTRFLVLIFFCATTKTHTQNTCFTLICWRSFATIFFVFDNLVFAGFWAICGGDLKTAFVHNKSFTLYFTCHWSW